MFLLVIGAWGSMVLFRRRVAEVRRVPIVVVAPLSFICLHVASVSGQGRNREERYGVDKRGKSKRAEKTFFPLSKSTSATDRTLAAYILRDIGGTRTSEDGISCTLKALKGLARTACRESETEIFLIPSLSRPQHPRPSRIEQAETRAEHSPLGSATLWSTPVARESDEEEFVRI